MKLLMQIYLVVLVALAFAMLVLLASCGTVTMTKTGDDITWKSRTLFKDIQDVQANAAPDAFDFSLGSSSGNLSVEQTQALACVLSPAACSK